MINIIELLKLTEIKYSIQNDRIIIHENIGLYMLKASINKNKINNFHTKNDIADTFKGNNITVEGNLDFSLLETLNELQLNNYIITGNLWLDNITELPEDSLNDCIIYGNLDLRSLIYLPKIFLKNSIVYSNLDLGNLEYLPKGFNPNVKGEICLDNLKSKTLRDLIHDPGPSRQLGFNLLRII